MHNFFFNKNGHFFPYFSYSTSSTEAPPNFVTPASKRPRKLPNLKKATSIVPTSDDVIEQLRKDYHKRKIKQQFRKSAKKHESPRR